ncbi:hypothetical protein NGM99_21105 [Mesorhizobium sp. RP14(2022)]|uniref:DUF6894 domain-containing protein n=1 Tax=Mesorhizobium liriopis TaxID=2953882 RepID=A0ABT1CDL6_9HYPH|nr:hypothetical protein [Mesorhizobium liriopis]MCO6052291.1 hypothetical protein [Mesorhizobium liriopis]
MPLYFFDTFDNGQHSRDDLGTLCSSLPNARMEAMKVLPSIAKDEIPRDGDRQAFTVLVRNEDGEAVYSATLTFAGIWLNGDGTK